MEYKRFLKLHDIDIQRLQEYIGNDLLKYPLSGVELLEKNYKQNGSDYRGNDSSVKKEGRIPPRVRLGSRNVYADD